MQPVVQERINRLNDILVARRKQVVFRLFIAGVVIAAYTGPLGPNITFGWATVYGLLQIVEWGIFTPFELWPRIEHRWQTWAALTLFAMNTAVFGVIGILTCFQMGQSGIAIGVILLAGAMLNAVLTVQGSKTAFWVTMAPIALYLNAVPFIAGFNGVGLTTAFALFTGSSALTFSCLKLWAGARLSHLSEKEARADAEHRRAEAESAVAAKSAFVAVVSHELRTPISAILAGAAELERISGGVGRQHARLISDAGAMMRTLLNDLLDLAKLDAGRMAVENMPYDFRALMTDQMRFWRAEAMKKNVALRLTGAKAAPGWVAGDPMRLRQILNNLISNALKFTSEGSVTVAIASTALAEGRTALEIAIVDTGSGMTAEQVDKLFQPFVQADASVARTHGGTGLGLTISRELARLLGGDITVASVHGEGSRFTVSLMVEAAEAVADAAEPGVQPNAPTSMAILVVDDHEINRRAVSLMLEPLQAEVTLAASAAEALELMAVRPFDVVLTDVHMPDMSGPDMVRTLRHATGPNRETPVIAITGATEPADVQACLGSGMNDWVAKPIDAGQLYDALARQLGEAEDDADAAAAA